MVKHVLLENDECLVPWEVIKPGLLNVSVFCGDLITADYTEVRIWQSGYEDGGSPEDPTPTIYEQIIAMLNDVKTGDVPEEQIANAVEKYLEAHPIETLTEETVKQIVCDYITEHKSELKGESGNNGSDGYTPVKGTDYWTLDDISEIQSYIDNQIGGALNGSY